MKRCPFCRAKGGRANILLNQDGYCDVCKRWPSGKKFVPYRYRLNHWAPGKYLNMPKPIRVSDAEARIWGRRR